jgi:hypothetical protein
MDSNPAIFDARAFQCPKEDVANVFLWRVNYHGARPRGFLSYLMVNFMNEQEEIDSLYSRYLKVRNILDNLDDLEKIPFDKLDEYDMILGDIEKEMEELENDYDVTDFLINGSRMKKCPEK